MRKCQFKTGDEVGVSGGALHKKWSISIKDFSSFLRIWSHLQRVRNLVVSDLRSETKVFQLEPGC